MDRSQRYAIIDSLEEQKKCQFTIIYVCGPTFKTYKEWTISLLEYIFENVNKNVKLLVFDSYRYYNNIFRAKKLMTFVNMIFQHIFQHKLQRDKFEKKLFYFFYNRYR